jgi:hypothetical protein
VYLLWRYSRQVLTNRWETTTRIELQLSWGGIPNSYPGILCKGSMGHLWYNSGTNFGGLVSANALRDYPSARTIRTFKSPTLGLTPTTPFRGVLYTCRSLAWVELLSFVVGLQTRPTKREACVQREQERLQESVLNRHSESHCKLASLRLVFISN